MFSEKMSEILRSNQMSTRASYYAGRGVITSDLNEGQLFAIHKSIQKEFGENSAKSFIYMVRDISDLSASNFLEALELLETNSFEWKPELFSSAEKFPVDTKNPVGMGIGLFLTINSNETKESILEKSNSLKFHFLKTLLTNTEYNEWSKIHSKQGIYGDNYFKTPY